MIAEDLQNSLERSLQDLTSLYEEERSIVELSDDETEIQNENELMGINDETKQENIINGGSSSIILSSNETEKNPIVESEEQQLNEDPETKKLRERLEHISKAYEISPNNDRWLKSIHSQLGDFDFLLEERNASTSTSTRDRQSRKRSHGTTASSPIPSKSSSTIISPVNKQTDRRDVRRAVPITRVSYSGEPQKPGSVIQKRQQNSARTDARTQRSFEIKKIKERARLEMQRERARESERRRQRTSAAAQPTSYEPLSRNIQQSASYITDVRHNLVPQQRYAIVANASDYPHISANTVNQPTSDLSSPRYGLSSPVPGFPTTNYPTNTSTTQTSRQPQKRYGFNLY